MGSIELRNVVLKYEDRVILNGITEFIRGGSLYVILGASGSGKSSLLKVIAGLQRVDKGEVIVDGENIQKASKQKMLEYHKKSGFVFQNSALISNMSVYENLMLYYNYHYPDKPKKDVEEVIMQYVKEFGIEEDLYLRPSKLSEGERRLVSIIRAVSHDPEYLFLDEPFSSIDPERVEKVKKLILDLKKRGKTIILTTHDTQLASQLADTIGILCNGKLVRKGL